MTNDQEKLDTSIVVRPFNQRELATIQDIRELAFKPIFDSFRNIVGPVIAQSAFASAEREQAKLLSDLCAAGSSARVFVATLDDQIVGFVSMTVEAETEVGEIGLNAVHPEFASRGIGSRLYRYALDEMRSAGMRVATVGVGGDASHAAARRAYIKAGFGSSIPSQSLYQLL